MFDFPCDWKSGFVMDPTKKQRIGYIVAFNGLGLGKELETDITAYTAFNKGATEKPKYSKIASNFTAPSAENPISSVKVVGVIDHFSWSGGVGDPISISCYVSSESALQLKALQQLTLKTTTISSLGWWIADFDEETKEWFEQANPLGPGLITGQVNAPGKNDIRLHVSTDPEKVAPNIDINVYNLQFEVVPAANKQFTLHFANSATKKVVKSWGLVVGKQAQSTS